MVADIDQSCRRKAVQKQLKELAGKLLADTMARDLNQALIEFGALVCTPPGPGCHCCPVMSQSQAPVLRTYF